MGIDGQRLLITDSQCGPSARSRQGHPVSLSSASSYYLYLCDFVITTLRSTDGPIGCYVQRRLMGIMENLLHNRLGEQERADPLTGCFHACLA